MRSQGASGKNVKVIRHEEAVVIVASTTKYHMIIITHKRWNGGTSMDQQIDVGAQHW